MVDPYKVWEMCSEMTFTDQSMGLHENSKIVKYEFLPQCRQFYVK